MKVFAGFLMAFISVLIAVSCSLDPTSGLQGSWRYTSSSPDIAGAMTNSITNTATTTNTLSGFSMNMTLAFTNTNYYSTSAITGSVITIASGSAFTNSIATNIVDNGTYTVSGTNITFKSPSGTNGNYNGTGSFSVSGTTLTLSQAGTNYIYTKQ